MVDEFSNKCPITPKKSVSDPGALLLDADGREPCVVVVVVKFFSHVWLWLWLLET